MVYHLREGRDITGRSACCRVLLFFLLATLTGWGRGMAVWLVFGILLQINAIYPV